MDQINIIKSLSFFFINGLHDLLVAHVLVAAFHILFYFVVGIIEEGFQTNSLFLFFKGAQYLFSILQNWWLLYYFFYFLLISFRLFWLINLRIIFDLCLVYWFYLTRFFLVNIFPHIFSWVIIALWERNVRTVYNCNILLFYELRKIFDFGQSMRSIRVIL